MRLGLRGLTILLALATVAGLIALWPTGEDEFQDFGFARDFYDAKVIAVLPIDCPGIDPAVGPVPGSARSVECATYQFQLLAGPDEGEIITIEAYDIASGYGYGVNDKVVLARNPDAVDERFRYSIADRQRKPALFWLAVLFAVCVVALGRLRGLAALAGLAATLALLLAFTLPAIVEGTDALQVALVSASAIAFVAIYLAHGLSDLTTVALLGTLGALGLTAALAVMFTELAGITGFASEESSYLALGSADIDIAGLILAGIVIGALGAIDDMTVTQASAVAEIRRADPTISTARLYRAGIRIGRDHVASTVNTLVLAYAGASMPLLVLFTVTDQSLMNVANGELVATEIVRTLVGSIGLVAAVPLTTWLAALVTSRATPAAVARPTDAAPGSGSEGGLA